MLSSRLTPKAFFGVLATMLAAAFVSLCMVVPAYADTGEAGWNVTLNSSGKLVSDYDQQKAAIDSALSGLLPGDSFTLRIHLKNDNEARSSWYMTNKAIKTLEEASEASNGAYTYELLYNDNVIYGSNTVGGDNASGFMEISNATGDWFWLGYIDPGGDGNVVIRMSLDGETQNNSYMNTVGQLSVSFAVEFNDGQGKRFVEEGKSSATPTSAKPASILKTGDVVAGIALICCVVAALAFVVLRISRRARLEKGSGSI